MEDLCIPGNGWHRWLPYYVQHWERSDGISASRRLVSGMRQTYLTGTLLMEGISLLVFGVLDTGFAKQSLEITLQDELDNVLVLHASSGVQATKISVARQKQPEPVQPILAEFFKTGKSGGNGKMRCIVRRSGSFC